MSFSEQFEILKKSHQATLHSKWAVFDYLGILADRLGVLAVRTSSMEDDCLNVCGMDRADYISTSLVLITEELVRMRGEIVDLLSKDGVDHETI